MERDNMNNTKKSIIKTLERDLEVIDFLIKESENFSSYTDNDLTNMETIQTGANLLSNINYFKSPDDVIHYFEKSWHYTDEVNRASFVSHVESLFDFDILGNRKRAMDSWSKEISNPNSTFAEFRKAVEMWLVDYQSNMTMDLQEVKEQLVDDLSMYK